VGDVELIADLNGIRVAGAGRLFFNAWDSTPTLETVTRVGDEQLRWFEGRGEKLIVLTLLNPRAGVSVTAEVRRHARETADRTEHTTAGMCTLIEEGGFFAATVRMVMNGIFLLRPPAYPQTSVREATDAAAFAHLHTGGAVSEPEALAAIESFRTLRP
jgi:hypothetical protein